MTATVIPFRRRYTPPKFDLGCPKCGANGGVLNLGPEHWAICETHKIKWHLGTDLPFLSWQHENEQVWYRNAVKLQGYQRVEPMQERKP